MIRIIVILTTIEATEFIKCLKRLGFYIHLKDKTVDYMYVHQITYLSDYTPVVTLLPLAIYTFLCKCQYENVFYFYDLIIHELFKICLSTIRYKILEGENFCEFGKLKEINQNFLIQNFLVLLKTVKGPI